MKVAFVTTGETWVGDWLEPRRRRQTRWRPPRLLCAPSERQVTMQWPRYGCGQSSKEFDKDFSSKLEKVRIFYICLVRLIQCYWDREQANHLRALQSFIIQSDKELIMSHMRCGWCREKRERENLVSQHKDTSPCIYLKQHYYKVCRREARHMRITRSRGFRLCNQSF